MPEDVDDNAEETNWRRALEAKANRADELEEQLAAVQRQAAFIEAGITSANPASKYFMKAYDGELTADAIRAEATAAGFLQPAAPSAQQDSPTLSHYGRIVEASEGATPAPTTDLMVGINNAKTAEEVMELMSAHVDPRTGQAFRTTWNTQ
jgi:hypothetical protein